MYMCPDRQPIHPGVASRHSDGVVHHAPRGADATFNLVASARRFFLARRKRTLRGMRNPIAIARWGAALAVLAVAMLPQVSRAATLEEVLAKNLAARGG